MPYFSDKNKKMFILRSFNNSI